MPPIVILSEAKDLWISASWQRKVRILDKKV
jgi:hypothetical protein